MFTQKNYYKFIHKLDDHNCFRFCYRLKRSIPKFGGAKRDSSLTTGGCYGRRNL